MVRQPKRLALLVHLALTSAEGGHRRDKLVALFWPELDQTRARAALNQALYALRTGLGHSLFLPPHEELVAVRPGALWCDVLAFEEALAAGRWDAGLTLYRGDLLDGFFISDAPEFERWVDAERSRLRARAAAAAWTLAEDRAAEGNTTDAIHLAGRATRLAPFEETVVRRLMTFLCDLGDRTAAIRAYEEFTSRLRTEYELEPSVETRQLASAIRREMALAAASAIAPAPPTVVRGRAGGRRIRAAPIATAALGFLAIVLVGIGTLREQSPRLMPMHLSLDLGGRGPLAGGVGGSTVALSPDGAQLVYVASSERGQELYLRAMDGTQATPIPGTDGATHPIFSPDGHWVGFVAGGAIKKVRVASGDDPVVVCTPSTNVPGLSWGDNGAIVFATPAGLWLVSAEGGEPRPVALSDTAGGVRYRWPSMLPGGRGALFTLVSDSGFELAAISYVTGRIRLLGISGSNPHFIEPGYVVFVELDGSLLAAPFDPDEHRLTGSLLPLSEDVFVGTAGAAKVGLARNGTLAYVPAPRFEVVLVDRSGSAVPVPIASGTPWSARFWPDGGKLLITISPGGDRPDVWIVGLSGEPLRRITFDSGSVAPVVQSGHAERIIFSAKPGGRRFGFELRSVPADGRDAAEPLLPVTHLQISNDVTRDGRFLLFQRFDTERRLDLWFVPLDGSRRQLAYVAGPANEHSGAIAPNSRWAAWTSDESGREEVYAGGFPERGTPVRISEGGGAEPRWSASGRELFYRGREGVIAVRIEDRAGLPHVVSRELLFDDVRYLRLPNATTYDVHPAGTRFVFLRPDPTTSDMLLVLNWVEQLRLRESRAQR